MIKTPTLDINFRTNEAARFLGFDPQTVTKMFDSGSLVGFRCDNGERRIYRSSIVQWLREHHAKFIHPALLCHVLTIGCTREWSNSLRRLLSPDDFQVVAKDDCNDSMYHESPKVVIANAGSVTLRDCNQIGQVWPDLLYSAVIVSEDGAGKGWPDFAPLPSDVSPASVAGKIKRLV